MAKEGNREVEFEGKPSDYPSKYKYKADRKRWAQYMYMHEGYNLSLNKVMKLLDLSRSWVFLNVNPNVSYIHAYGLESAVDIDEETGEKKKAAASGVYYNKYEFYDWLMNNSEFTVQTELINVFAHVEEKVARNIEFIINEKDINPEYRSLARGLIIKSLDNRAADLVDELFDLLPRDLAYSRKRADKNIDHNGELIYPRIPVKPFYWPDDERLIPASRCKEYYYTKKFDSLTHRYEKAKYTNNEVFYRDMFERGAIKITLCGSKVYFIPQNEPEHYNNVDGEKLWILVAADKVKHPEMKEIIIEAVCKNYTE